jgi:cysteine desulfurase
LHSDASQAPGKIPLDALALVDAFTLSSHKAHGPQGAAALVVRKQRSILPRPVIFGGGQEKTLWPGTLNAAAIVGFGEALERTVRDRGSDVARLATAAVRLMDGLEKAFPGCRRNGDPARTVPHCLSVTFADVAGETLVAALAREGVSAALGSACAGEAAAASHVLVAMGLSSDEVRRTLRFGTGRLTTDAEIDYALDVLSRLGSRFSG